MKRLTDQERQLAEAAARVIEAAENCGLPDAPDQLGIRPPTLLLIARAYVELREKIRALHDLVDLTDPKDPIGTALTKAGLERRPSEPLACAEPRLVRTAAEVQAMSGEELLALYCRVTHTSAAFFEHETYVVRIYDGMDNCWTDCTDPITRDAALQIWAAHTGGGTRHVAFAEIDYYRIFPSSTRMLFDGSEQETPR